MMMGGRFIGSAHELAEVLRRCVSRGGRSFVRCSEESSVSESITSCGSVPRAERA